jgi:2-polyprenyl-3-methyl-5-hydroxy-6-metoxy-1,4-benzoquinol methylase
MGKTSYLKKCITAQFDPVRWVCPNCGGAQNTTVARKFLITSLRRCSACELQFRAPTDDPSSNLAFYEREYFSNLTTNMPSDDGLAKLIANDFEGGKNWTYYNDILKRLGLVSGARVFDFGCSWGYGAYQMGKAGYSVLAFEIAPTRKKYAEDKLSVSTVADMEEAVIDPRLTGTFDCFFSSHVLEHVPCPSKVFRFADVLLRRGGLFVSFTPNGSEAARSSHPQWSKWWGEVHPNFIDDRFLNHAFHRWPRVVGSSPVGAIEFPSQPVMRRLDQLSGEELFFSARKG